MEDEGPLLPRGATIVTCFRILVSLNHNNHGPDHSIQQLPSDGHYLAIDEDCFGPGKGTLNHTEHELKDYPSERQAKWVWLCEIEPQTGETSVQRCHRDQRPVLLCRYRVFPLGCPNFNQVMGKRYLADVLET